MAAAQDGDADAYKAVLTASIPVVLAIARRMNMNAAVADDVVQEVLLTIHRARHTYDPGRPFLPWLRAIANRRAIDVLRLHGRNGAREVHDPDAYLNRAGPEAGTETATDRQDEAATLRSAIATLPPRQRQAIELLGLQERSLAEASVQTGQTKTALKVNLHRAIRALRSRFGQTRNG